jgi:hypothetical protein
MRRCALLAVAVFLGCTLIQVLFAVFPWVALPMAWDVLVGSFAAGIGIVAVDLSWLRRPDLRTVARIAENQARLPHPWLSLSLELSDSESGGSAELTSRVFETAAGKLPLCPTRLALPGFRRISYALALSLASFASTAFLCQPHCALFWKLPFSFFGPVRATIWPGTVYVPKGALCTVRLTPAGSFFPSCRLACSALDGTPASNAVLAADDSGLFSRSLGSVTRSLVYQFTVGNTAFPADTIRVVPKPALSRLAVRVVPPRYTGIKPSSLPEGQGNFAAYPGTRAHFFLSAPFPLKKALFVSPGKDTIPFLVSKCDAQGDIVVSSRQSYSFALTDTFLQTSDSVPLFSIEVIPDAPPSVFILKPGENKDCTPVDRELLSVEALDDMAIRSVVVSTRKNRDEVALFASRRFPPGDSSVKVARLELPLSLGAFSLYPGDTLWYWATACDNRAYHGPQCTTSDSYFFRVPSFEEIHERVAQEEDYTTQALASAKKRNSDLQQSVANLMQSARGKKSLSWEQQQIVRDLKQEAASQADSLSKALESFREAVDKIKQESSIPAELLSKMDEVQKAIEDLRRQYGDSLLFSTPKGEENISTRDLRESLEKLKNTLPDLAQRLENTLKFLEMLKRDQELARLASDAERLAKDQQDIASMPREGGECLSKQENVCKGVDGLLKDIDKNAGTGDSSLFSKSQLPALDKLCPLQKSMQADLSSKTVPPRSDMNTMAGSLSSLSENLANMQSCALAKRFEKEREVLLDMVHDALGMSALQEEIADGSQAPSASAGETSALEQTLANSLRNSMEKMNRLAMVSPQALVSIKKGYDHAGASINDALALLSGGDRRIYARGPESDFNSLAKTELDALAQLSGQSQGQSGGMGGMMAGFRRLSSRQASLNAATGALLRSLLGRNGGSEGMEGKDSREGGGGKEGSGERRAREEARAAQKAIADELKRLADKYGKDAGSSLDKKARDLEEEARRLSAMFDNPSQELRDRQDRFLSRMLETSLSQHKQDEGKEERKSQSAKEVFLPQGRDNAARAAGSFDLDTYYLLRQRAFVGNFPESYRFSVKSYFDSLGVLFLKEK